MKNNEELNVSMAALIIFISTISLFLVVVGVQAWYYNVKNAEEFKKVVSQSNEKLNNVLAEQQEKLNSYRWINEEDKIAGMPIDRAIELVIHESKSAYTGIESPTKSQAGGKRGLPK